jgi:hypothetical protein
MSSNFSLIEKFGSDLLSASDPLFVDQPPLNLSPEEAMSLIRLLPDPPNPAVQVGISSVIFSLIPVAFVGMNGERLNLLKSVLIAAALRSLHKLAIEPFSDAVIDVYKRCDQNWPELTEFLFALDRNPTVGFIFVRFMSTTNKAF